MHLKFGIMNTKNAEIFFFFRCCFTAKDLICEPNIAKRALQYMICDFRDFLLFWLLGHFSFSYELHTRIP